MAYTPELSDQNSCTLRRIAWALDKPMTRALAAIIDFAGKRIDGRMVCEACRDRTRCESCAFSSKKPKIKGGVK